MPVRVDTHTPCSFERSCVVLARLQETAGLLLEFTALETRASRFAQPMRRGVIVASRSTSGRAGTRQSESWIGAGDCGEDGMSRARR